MKKKNDSEIIIPTKAVRGDKLHNNPKLEAIVIRWINEEPSLSNYKIAEQLREQFKFKITSPSIKTWRTKWYDKMKNEVKPEYEDVIKTNDTVEISVYHEISIDKYKNILETMKMLNELEVCMERVKSTFSGGEVDVVDEKTGEVTKVDNKYFFDKDKEDVYRGYISEILKIRKTIDGMLGEANIYKLVKEELMNFVKGVVFKVYSPENEELYEKFKKESAEFDTMLRQKYLVKF